MPNLFVHNDDRAQAIREITTTPATAKFTPIALLDPGERSLAIELPPGQYTVEVLYEGETNPQVRNVVLGKEDLTERFIGTPYAR